MADIAITRRRRPRHTEQTLQQLAAQFRLDELQVFNQVAEMGSFSAAAKVLGVTQSTASKRIRRLEESLDLRLFDRTTRQVALTDLGREFLGHSQRLMANFDEAIQFVQQSREEPVGTLRVGIPQWFMLALGSEFFANFLRKYPSIQFSFVNLKTAEQLVEQAEVDLMLHFLPPSDRKLTSTPLWEFKVDFFVGKDYLKSSPAIDHPGHLGQHDCLLIRNYLLPDREWLWTDEQGKRHSIAVRPLAHFDHVEQALTWAKQNLGVIWSPEQLVQQYDKDLDMTRLFGGAYASTFHMNAIYPARQVTSPKVKAFLDELCCYLQEKA